MKYLKPILFLFVAISIILTSCHNKISSQEATEDENIAMDRAEQLFIATFEGDVDKIKELTSPEFYDDVYIFDDETVRQELLSVPAAKREESINQVKNNSTYEASTDGDVITVYCTNNVNHKEFILKFKDIDGNGNWVVFEKNY